LNDNRKFYHPYAVAKLDKMLNDQDQEQISMDAPESGFIDALAFIL